MEYQLKNNLISRVLTDNDFNSVLEYKLDQLIELTSERGIAKIEQNDFNDLLSAYIDDKKIGREGEKILVLGRIEGFDFVNWYRNKYQ